MERKICLDTDFLINFLRNKKEESDFIKENEESCIFATTYINLFELYYGAFKFGKPKEIIGIELLKQRLTILNLDGGIVRKAGEVAVALDKVGRPIEFRDLLIGVTGLMNGFSLKTYNITDFSRIKGLKVL